MTPLEGTLYGLGVALTPGNLLACFLGALIGTIVGVLPGIGPVGAMALLLPITFGFHPTTAVIMLAGVYYGSQYGGSTTSILVNVPGEASSVVTTLDGYQMTRRGRGGAALCVAAVGSFIAGTVGVLGVVFFAAPLAELGLRFGPPEYLALAVAGLLTLSRLSGGSVMTALMMVGFGLALGTVGMEPMSGFTRYTFGLVQLGQGIELVPVIVGLYGIAEVLILAEAGLAKLHVPSVRLREMFPTREEWRRSSGPIARGSLVGFVIGLIPGPAGVLATFVSYTLERRVSRTPERFGKGAIEGVAGPESANNAATSSAMIPLLSLGIPFSAITAILLGALMIHGVQPGPLLITQRPDIFWGVIGSMYIGNAMLLILNLPLVGLFVNLLRLPQRLLATMILLLCIIGAFSVNNSPLDLWVLAVAGIAGYVFRKVGIDPSPLVVALVLGPLLERMLRQTLFLTRGDLTAILDRPITVTLLLIGVAALVAPALAAGARRARRLAQARAS